MKLKKRISVKKLGTHADMTDSESDIENDQNKKCITIQEGQDKQSVLLKKERERDKNCTSSIKKFKQ